MGLKPFTHIDASMIGGGNVTVRPEALLKYGSYSMIQNLRNESPGFKTRKGQRELHTDPDGSNQVMTLYKFSKSYVVESHLLAQMSDGDILEAENEPPAITEDIFGDEIFSGVGGDRPASWGNLHDQLIYSNGVDQHQIYGGTSSYVHSFVALDGNQDPDPVPEEGANFTREMKEPGYNSSIDQFKPHLWDQGESWFVKTPMPANSLYLEIVNANSYSSSPLIGYYWDGDWQEMTSFVDQTSVGGRPLAQSGALVFGKSTAAKAAELTKYMFGECGFWYRFRVDYEPS